MDRRSVLQGFAMGAVGVAMLSGGAEAQRRKKKDANRLNARQLAGHWSLVSVDNVAADGTRMPAFGSNPTGVAIFEPNHRFSVSVVNSDMPKFASNDRENGSDEENKAAVRGSLTYFGTYQLAGDGTLSLEVEGSSFPNWTRVAQKRMVTSLTADELKWTTPGANGATNEITWKRTK
jgi:hypothetical protein